MIPRDRGYYIAYSHIFIIISSVVLAIFLGFSSWFISYYFHESFVGARPGHLTFLLAFFLLLSLSYISILFLGALSRADDIFLAKLFTMTSWSIIATIVSILSIRLLFEGLRYTSFFTGLIFFAGIILLSYWWRRLQYKEIRKYILNIANQNFQFSSKGISTYFITLINAMISKDEQYKYQINKICRLDS